MSMASCPTHQSEGIWFYIAQVSFGPPILKCWLHYQCVVKMPSGWWPSKPTSAVLQPFCSLRRGCLPLWCLGLKCSVLPIVWQFHFESLSGMWILHHFCLRENAVINFFNVGLVQNCLKSWRLPLCQLKMGQSGQRWWSLPASWGAFVGGTSLSLAPGGNMQASTRAP